MRVSISGLRDGVHPTASSICDSPVDVGQLVRGLNTCVERYTSVVCINHIIDVMRWCQLDCQLKGHYLFREIILVSGF